MRHGHTLSRDRRAPGPARPRESDEQARETRSRTALLALLCVDVGALAGPQLTAVAAQKIESVCVRDVERLCPNLGPGRQLRKCIQEKQSEFSPECKAHIQEREDRRRVFQESCADDVRTFCVNTQAGRGRVRPGC